MGVGCAIYDQMDKKSFQFRLKEFTSIYSAELIAVKEAIKYARSCSSMEKDILIFTDNMAVVTKLRHPAKSHSTIILEIQKMILSDDLLSKIRVIWVKGHASIGGNEVVDALAKEAITSGIAYSEPYLAADIKNLVRRSNYTLWQDEYNSSKTVKAKFYSAIQPSIPVKPWYSTVGASRTFYTAIVRLRLNHNRTPSHLFRIGVLPDKQCTCGEEAEADSNHLILACPQRSKGRDNLWEAIVENKLELPTNLQQILAGANIVTLEAIVNHIKHNHILI
ncbi:uncharacterized protein [Rhodnius prolixus]|uniref:uncharacterized protein n=1 Tax=Rhodnius prolixus TaxID=13249 RepID=UPI003D1877C5